MKTNYKKKREKKGRGEENKINNNQLNTGIHHDTYYKNNICKAQKKGKRDDQR